MHLNNARYLLLCNRISSTIKVKFNYTGCYLIRKNSHLSVEKKYINIQHINETWEFFQWTSFCWFNDAPYQSPLNRYRVSRIVVKNYNYNSSRNILTFCGKLEESALTSFNKMKYWFELLHFYLRKNNC